MSYNSTWEENAVEILNQVKFLMQSTEIFPINNVRVLGNFIYWRARRESYPNIAIRLSRDRVGFATADEEQHMFYLDLLPAMKSTVKRIEDHDLVEENNLAFLDMIGQIDEAIRGNNTLNGEANWALIRDKNLTYGWEEGFLYYEALLLVEVMYVW